jgi:predicted alpha/beta hydrolase family esterase
MKDETSNVFIFHGTEGHPQENWFPWLKQELKAKGYDVTVPQFPSPPVVPAKISEWFDVLKDYEDKINEDTVIVGHSLGGIFTLRVLEKLNHPIKTAFFVGAPIGVRPVLNYDRDSAFSGFDFDWENIKQKAKNFVVYHSDDDPYVGLDNGKELAKHLGVELSFIPNAGHFNKRAGYTKFEDLKSKLLNLLEAH